MEHLRQPQTQQPHGVAPVLQFGKQRRKTDATRKIGNVKIIDNLPDKQAMGDVAAEFVQRLLHGHRLRRSLRGHPPVIVFPTGGTPKPMYEKLRTMYGLNWNGAHLFHLDEYASGQRGDEVHPDLSYRHEMNRNLWGKLNSANRYYMGDFINEPEKYEQRLRNLGDPDLVILGIGPNGHLAFNEPPDKAMTNEEYLNWAITRHVPLSPATLKANFGVDSVEEAREKGYPVQAATLGMRTILSAKKIILLAGKGKEDILNKALTGPVTPDVPASFLQTHRDVTVITDFKI